MCGIFASKSKEKFIELMEINAYRGSYSHSIAIVDLQTKNVVRLLKNLGPMDISTIPDSPNKHTWYIGHVQAPTTQDGMCVGNIHPAFEQNNYMWHNGIIKEQCIIELQDKTNSNSNWDTHLLLKYFNNGYDLSLIDGTFACVLINDNINVFRNAISPMFVDDDLNISSVRFLGSIPLEPGIVHIINDEKLKPLDVTFTTKNNPYIL